MCQSVTHIGNKIDRRKNAATYTTEETTKYRSSLGVNLYSKKFTEGSNESSIDTFVIGDQSSSNDRLVSSDVGSCLESFLVESRFSIGNDSSYVSLDTSGHSLSSSDNSSSGVDGRSNGSGRSGSESVLVEESCGFRVDECALVVETEKTTKEFAESERSLQNAKT